MFTAAPHCEVRGSPRPIKSGRSSPSKPLTRPISWAGRAAWLQSAVRHGEEKSTIKQVEDMLAHVVASKARGWMDTLDPIVGV
jgi:hypothetical protein